MKRIFAFGQCLKILLKKKIFNSSKTDISHECQRMINDTKNLVLADEEKREEEYIDNYNITTRWQTV